MPVLRTLLSDFPCFGALRLRSKRRPQQHIPCFQILPDFGDPHQHVSDSVGKTVPAAHPLSDSTQGSQRMSRRTQPQQRFHQRSLPACTTHRIPTITYVVPARGAGIHEQHWFPRSLGRLVLDVQDFEACDQQHSQTSSQQVSELPGS